MRTALLACALSVVSAGAACAEPCKDRETPLPAGDDTPFHSQITLLAENDMFNGTNDRNYTSGLQLGATMRPNARFERTLNDLICHARGRAWAFDLNLTNMIFTPQNLTLDPPDVNDRPYAGVTALTLEAFSTDAREHVNDLKPIHFDEVGLSLGIVGPNSGSDTLQSWWHRSVLHIGLPAGWDDQEPNRALVQLSYQHTDMRRTVSEAADAGHTTIGLDWSTAYGFGAGTFLDYAHVGANARVGVNIGEDYGPPRIDPSMHGAGYWNPKPEDAYLGGYVFAGADQRFVFFDRTLDAHPSHVERRDWVGDAEWGWVAHIGGIRLAGVYVWRNRQFRSQPEPDSFGSYSATFSLCLDCYSLWDRDGRFRRLF